MELHEIIARILRTSKCNPMGTKKVLDLVKEFELKHDKEELESLPEWSKWITFIKNFISPLIKELEKMDCCNAAQLVIGAILFEYPFMEDMVKAWIKDKCNNESRCCCCRELQSYVAS